MSAARKKSLNYNEFTSLIKFPLTDKTVKKVGRWLDDNANKPGFDINKLVFKTHAGETIPAILTELVEDTEKESISFLPYLAAEASTLIDRSLFLSMIAIIPTARLRELKEPVTPLQEKEKTLAHYAVLNKKFSKIFIKELHKKGMDVNQGTSDYGSTPAHRAGAWGSIDALEALIECKVDIDSAGKSGLTPCELAYINGQQKAVEFLKKERSAVLDPVKLYGIYAKLGDVSTLKKLKRDYNNIDVNKKFGKWDQTALIIAVAQNKMEVVKYLLNEEKSTNTHLVDKTGFNALHYAVKLGNYPMVDILLKQKDSTQDIDAGMLFDAFEIAEKDKPYRFLILYKLVNILAEAKYADRLNRVNPATGDTPLHYAVREVKPETYINTLIETKLVDVNTRSAPPSSLTPLEYAVKENKARAVTSLLNINSIEINPEKLLSIAIQNNSYQVLQLLIDQNIMTDLAFCLQELIKSVKKDDPMKNAIIEFLLKKCPPSDLAKALPEGVSIAIKADAKETAILLTDHLTKETLSEEECLKLRETSQNNTMKLVLQQLKKIYPIAVSKVNETIYVPAAVPPASVDEQKDRAKRLLVEMDEAKQLYESQYRNLLAFHRELKGYTETAAIVESSEQKTYEVNKEYLELQKQDPENINELTRKLKHYHEYLNEKSHHLLRIHPPKIKEDKNSGQIKKTPLKGKKKKRVARPPKLVKTLFTQSELKAKNQTQKPLEEPSNNDERRKIKRENVKQVLDQSRKLIKTLKITINDKTDEVAARKLLHTHFNDEKISFKDKFSIKLYLESLFMELAINAPIGLGVHSKKESRNNIFYKKFNEDNLEFKSAMDNNQTEDVSIDEKLTSTMADLLVGLNDYMDFLNESTGEFKKGDLTFRSSLINQMTEKSKDSRDVFSNKIKLFREGRKMAHNQYYDTFHGVITTRIIQGCALLDEKEKAFAESYSWLRMTSEGQKANVPLTLVERTLANAWRHSGEKSRTDITSEVDSNYLQKITPNQTV